MVRCCLAYAVIVVYSAAAPYSLAQAEPRAVIELFTSQGCSSCPPADQLLGELADDPSLVSVSVPVDYWDYLGWKDTLADPRNTARQKAYAHARGDGQVYTPQVVVNGSLHALGSDKAAIELAIAASRKNGAMSLLPTLALTDGRLNVSVPDAADFHTGEEDRYRRHWARRKQRPRDHLPQRRAAVGQARRLDRQGQFVEHTRADAQER